LINNGRSVNGGNEERKRHIRIELSGQDFLYKGNGFMGNKKRVAFRANEAGGIAVRVALALGSLVMVGCVVVWVITSFQKQQPAYSRKAMENCEYGLLQALQKLQENPSWEKGFPRTVYNNGWYSVHMSRHRRDGEIIMSIEAMGKSGWVAQRREYYLKLIRDENGDSLWIEDSRM
jgi:hypothetical protein